MSRAEAKAADSIHGRNYQAHSNIAGLVLGSSPHVTIADAIAASSLGDGAPTYEAVRSGIERMQKTAIQALGISSSPTGIAFAANERVMDDMEQRLTPTIAAFEAAFTG